MQKNISNRNKKLVAPLLLSLLVSACGGGNQDSEGSSTVTATTATITPVEPIGASPTPVPTQIPDPISNSSMTITRPGAMLPPPSSMPTPIAPVSIEQVITNVTIKSTDLKAQSNVPFTFGQVFSQGDLHPTDGLTGKLSNGEYVLLQMDIKSTHPDGSVRHAIISGIMPSLAGSVDVSGSNLNVELVKTNQALSNGVSPEVLLNKGFKAGVSLNLGGTTYSANAEDFLNNNSKKWLDGGVVNEWVFSAPLKTSSGLEHPHLHVRFSIRYYPSSDKAKVDFTIENNWAYELAPQNFTYDATLTINNIPVYTKLALNHAHHARWRKVFWWGEEPKLHIAHNSKYLIATKAIPNYDPTVVISPTAIANMKKTFVGTRTEPMGNGMAIPAMGTTGGRPDIGILPGWAVTYLLTMDKDAKDIMLKSADLAGSWSSHYRDKKTNRPIDLFDYPYMTILGNKGDTLNRVTRQYEKFPACGGICTNKNVVDTSHQPGFAYLPYIVTGDYYYMEELQFWGMFNAFYSNPGYRQNIKGLVKPDQVRGQAWSLRTIGQAGYILPDADPLKPHFQQIISTNMDWYDENYTNKNTPDNLFGALTHGYAMVYNSKKGLAPWQDDFFTAAVGHLAELGYTKANGLLAFKAKFPVGRMTAPGMCWILGSNYTLNLRSAETAPYYTDWNQLYNASVAPNVVATECASQAMVNALAANGYKVKVGEMTGYSYSNTGYPSNMQPALAYSVNSGIPNSAAAWKIFMSRTTLPDYHNSAQFAIVPRQ